MLLAFFDMSLIMNSQKNLGVKGVECMEVLLETAIN